jgi:tetratricopeptide (TPR) repeat protein
MQDLKNRFGVVVLSKNIRLHIQKLEEQLRKDPKSQVFVSLAEAYREDGQHKKAEKIVREGLAHNPNSISGLVALARILKEQKKYRESLEVLNLTTEKKPDNILAQLCKAELHLGLKEPKQALQCYKLVLFYNPTHPLAMKAISKLESLTADEYDDDLFSMSKLTNLALPPSSSRSQDPHQATETLDAQDQTKNAGAQLSRSLDRLLSLSDAFMVRQEFDKAQKLLQQGIREHSHHPEIQKRLNSLEKMTAPLQSESTTTAPEKLKPLASREQWVREKKIERLQKVLQRIEASRPH